MIIYITEVLQDTDYRDDDVIGMRVEVGTNKDPRQTLIHTKISYDCPEDICFNRNLKDFLKLPEIFRLAMTEALREDEVVLIHQQEKRVKDEEGKIHVTETFNIQQFDIKLGGVFLDED